MAKDEDEIIATKLNNGSMTLENLLDYWYIKYGIPKYQLEYIKERLKNGK